MGWPEACVSVAGMIATVVGLWLILRNLGD